MRMSTIREIVSLFIKMEGGGNAMIPVVGENVTRSSEVHRILLDVMILGSSRAEQTL